MSGYEEQELTAIDAALDANPDATSNEVFQATRPYDERAIASVAASRALAGGGGGGGTTPVDTPRTEYKASTDLLPATDKNYVAWVLGPATGFEILDLTDPTYPLVTEDGIYAVTAEMSLDHFIADPALPDLTGKAAVLELSLDDTNFGWFTRTAFPLDVGASIGGSTAFVGPCGNVSLTGYVPAGGALAMILIHDATADMRFHYFVAIHKIA